jgi:hypothetical protein
MMYPKLDQSTKIEEAYERISPFNPRPKISDMVIKENRDDTGGDSQRDRR